MWIASEITLSSIPASFPHLAAGLLARAGRWDSSLLQKHNKPLDYLIFRTRN